MKDISVQSLPLHKPIILPKTRTLKEAAQTMKRANVGSVLVSDGDGMLKGLFTDRDLALKMALQDGLPSDTLENATEKPLIYVTESASLKDVVNVMIKYSIRRVPVVHLRGNGRHRCLGIITLDDLVKRKLIDISEEAKILYSQIQAPKASIARGRMRSIFHSKGHKEHSLHTFMKTVESRTSLKRGKAQLLTNQALMMILRRIPEKQGLNVLSQLPHELQMQMLSYVSPADRSINGRMLLAQVKKSLHVDETEAKFLLERFWAGLEESISAGEISNLSRELPKDFMNLFNDKTAH